MRVWWFVCVLFWWDASAAANLNLQASPAQSTDGSTRLSWELPAGANAHVQVAISADFSTARTLYLGTDTASVITGLGNGEYHYRARAEFADGQVTPWSQSVVVRVTHHSLLRAVLFFSLGAIVFLATLWLVVRGTRLAGSDA